jgi:uncharacterized protein YndB with AHSA1/START domain
MKSDVKITGNHLQITRVFDAPRERVFAAWKTREMLQRWSGCKETTRNDIELDFRVGGSFTHKMQIDGAGEHTIRGVYDEIIEPEKIVYHVDLGPATTRVKVELFAEGDKTKMVLTQDGFPDPGVCKIVSQGTMEGLDKLEQLLAAQQTN